MVTKKQTTKRITKKPTTKATTVTRRTYERVFESDGTYLLKLVSCLLLGTLWLRFAEPISWMGVPLGALPIGLLLGLILVNRFESHQSDRKIWYAILIIISICGFFWNLGIVL